MGNSSIQPSTQSTMVACRRTILRWAMPSPARGGTSVYQPNLPAYRIACTRRAIFADKLAHHWPVAGNKLEGNRDSQLGASPPMIERRRAGFAPISAGLGVVLQNSFSNSPWLPFAPPALAPVRAIGRILAAQ